MDRTNRNTALASAFVEELGRSGVRQAVICPGSRSTPLALALLREPSIETCTIVDERSAGFFALGHAQADGVPVAVLTTSGTAAANLHPAVCEADESGIPLIALTADRPPELRGVGAGQTIDQLKLYGSAVRWFCEVGTHEADDAGLLHLRQTACRAFATATGDSRPGPVHVNLSWRDPLGPEPAGDVTASSGLALEGRDAQPLTALASPPAAVAPFLISELGRHITENRRGLIICGRQTDPALAEPVAALAKAAGYPILAEPTSQLRLGPHDRSLVVCHYDAIARLRPERLEPELILRFGEMPTSKALRRWIAAMPQVAQLVVDPTGKWNEPSRQAAAIVRANPVELAGALAGAVTGVDLSEACERWLAVDGVADEAVEKFEEPTTGVSEPAVHRQLGRLYRDGDLVYTASSMPIRDQEAFLSGGPAQVRFLANRGANGIDGLVSSGIGAAVATGAPTWVIAGDLGLHHDSNALAALRHSGSPVRIVVLNNDGGGIFEHLPQAGQIEPAEFEAILGTPLGYDVQALAATYGVRHTRVGSVEELGGAASAVTGIIEVPIDRKANVTARNARNEAAVDAVRRELLA